MSQSFAVRYRAAAEQLRGACPIEAGTLGRLADHECRYGRLAGDRTRSCGCFAAEHGVLYTLPIASREKAPIAAQRDGKPNHHREDPDVDPHGHRDTPSRCSATPLPSPRTQGDPTHQRHQQPPITT